MRRYAATEDDKDSSVERAKIRHAAIEGLVGPIQVSVDQCEIHGHITSRCRYCKNFPGGFTCGRDPESVA